MNPLIQKWLPHVAALLVFLLVGLTYFSPVLEGKRLKQGDLRNFLGMAKEIRDHRAVFEEEPLWTNSMFGGMPAYQIAVKYPGAVLKVVDKAFQLFTPRPLSYVLLYMIGFYILMMAFRVNPWLAIAGSIAFAFSSYYFIIIEAGHNTKAHAIAYMAPTLAGIVLAYRGKFLLGGALTALFVALQIQANHVQITYYFGILAIFYALAEGVRAFKNKELMEWLKPSALLLVAALLGVMCNFASLYNTWEYGKHTTRGPSELTILPGGESNEEIATRGLDRDYVTQWSYGIGETWSLLIPNAKGGATGAIGEGSSHLKNASPQFRSNIAGSNQYWGNQPFTSGPVYFGAIVMYLFILGVVLLKGPLRWGMLATVVLTVMLAWGKNFMALTDFFLDVVPGYDKFRAVTIILSVTGLAVPLLGVLVVNRWLKHPEELKAAKKPLLITSGALLGLMLLMIITPGSFFSFLSDMEVDQFGRQMQQSGGQSAMIGQFMDELEKVRMGIFRADAMRSFAFVLGAAALLFLYMRRTLQPVALIAALGVLVLVDMWTVNKRYLNNEKERGRYTQWEDPWENLFPHQASAADLSVLNAEISNRPGLLRMAGDSYAERRSFDEMVQVHEGIVQQTKEDAGVRKRALSEDEKNIAKLSALNFMSNFRVLNLNNPFNDGVTPYFHKSVGGYHGAKLQRIQELIDFYLRDEVADIMRVMQDEPTQSKLDFALLRSPMLNMLNTRYVIYNPGAPPIRNRSTLGAAWIVQNVEVVPNADEEMLALEDLDPEDTAVMDARFESYLGETRRFAYDSLASVSITSYKPNELSYDFSSGKEQFVVFSEIFYDAGWQAYLNDEPVDYVRVNYLLRGMKIPAGEHTIVFRFEPEAFHTTARIAMISSWLMLLLVAGGLALAFRSRQSQQPEA